MPVVHNRGRKIGDKTVARKIIFPREWDADGQPVKEGKTVLTEILLPSQHKSVTDQQLAHLKANFHDEIINVEDIAEMQSQFKEKPAEKAREGYVHPDEVEERVAKRVAEELAKREGGASEETHEQLILRIDGMDRGDLIALIEKDNLDVEHKKFKAPGALKAAILSAMENKKAAESTEE